MIQVKLLAFILFTLLYSSLLAESNHSYLRAISIFDGDKHGEFKNDLVAFLSDESAWKVHPKDRDKFSLWNIEDHVHIQVRTSFYWFKREHKFELVNDSRQESVRAMLVQYPAETLYVAEAERYLANYHMKFYTTQDSRGNIHYHYYPVYTYKTRLRLSDGSIYITTVNYHYAKDDKVYRFVDHEDALAFILIKGIEREATWHKVSKE